MFEDGGLPYFFSFWVNADELSSILKTKYLVRSASVAVSDLSLSLYIYIHIYTYTHTHIHVYICINHLGVEERPMGSVVL